MGLAFLGLLAWVLAGQVDNIRGKFDTKSAEARRLQAEAEEKDRLKVAEGQALVKARERREYERQLLEAEVRWQADPRGQSGHWRTGNAMRTRDARWEALRRLAGRNPALVLAPSSGPVRPMVMRVLTDLAIAIRPDGRMVAR